MDMDEDADIADPGEAWTGSDNVHPDAVDGNGAVFDERNMLGQEDSTTGGVGMHVSVDILSE